MTTLSTSQARARLPEVLDRVEAGEEITITRHGRAVAVVVRPDALRARRAGPAIDAASLLHRRLTDGRHADMPEAALSKERADEIVAVVRSSRDAP